MQIRARYRFIGDCDGIIVSNKSLFVSVSPFFRFYYVFVLLLILFPRFIICLVMKNIRKRSL